MAQAGTVLILREPLIAYRFHASANTYRTFADMCEMTRWAEDSYRRRLESMQELTLDQFRVAHPQDICTRLRHYRKDSSRLHMRIAGQRFLDGRYIATAGHLVVAIMLHPADLIRRIRRYYGRS
jgi:hypothetical protein